ncbi:hypothetical protein Tel_01255 [Candidatus Tenderia electrophaga]|jgi:protein TonB|uniref:Protein TonB n=1 Tax=Candidatus Tenderia electrophaga TaxID=1748243 RepID=A0A0S2T9M8_9GAMM|nr:hypothetical protein Tel_01255 [Candidatus Tenderia electrophaga]
MEPGRRHWLAALGLALTAHAGLTLLLQAPPERGSRAAGAGGLEIALAPVAAEAAPETDVQAESQAEPDAQAAPEAQADRKPPAQPEPTEAPVAETEPQIEPEPQNVPEPLAEPEPLVEPLVEPEPRPAAEPATPAAEVTSAPAPSKTPAAARDPQPAPATEPSKTAQAAAPQQQGGGAVGLEADYFARLQAWLERHRQYPRRAQLRRQEGTALLYFVIERDGTVIDARIQRSSGHRLLDREVREMLERARPLPPLPAELAQAQLEVVVPVRFALR